MSYTCDKYCDNGNCIGCKDGKLNCKDSRCFPNCSAQCEVEHSHWKILFGLIIIFIVLILVGLIILITFQNFSFK